MRRTRLHSLVCVWAAATTASGGCGTTPKAAPRLIQSNADPKPAIATVPPTGRPQVPIDANATTAVMAVRTPDAKVTAPQAVVAALSDRDTAALLARMEPLPDMSAHHATAPTMRAPTAAPPRSGPAQPIAFVVPIGKPVDDAPVAPGSTKPVAPLAPPQISPQGEVRSESEVRIRFSEAMVPVASVNTATQPVATISPAVSGTWRWIDTRVVVFTAAGPRLPQATEFTVTVPAGTRALGGATLSEAARATFSTSPIALVGGYPTTKLRPDSPIVVKLDQEFDADKLLPFVRVTNRKGNVAYPYRASSLDAAQTLWTNNPSVAFTPAKADAALGKRYLVLQPRTAWPAGAEIQVVLKAGAPSREGPRASTRESFAVFTIAPAFAVRGLTCGDVETPRMFGAACPANGYIEVEFSNPIAIASYRSAKLQIDGEPFADNSASSYSGFARVGLVAPSAVGRSHGITVGDGILDVYGQPLVGGHKLSFVTSQERFFGLLETSTGLHVLDPRFEIPQWVIASQAVASLRVQLFRVQPKDYFAFLEYERGTAAVPPGKRVSDKAYAIGPQHGANLRVDLRPALEATGLGHVIAVATAEPLAGRERPPRAIAWIQVTKLGVSSRIDGERVSAWVQDITPNGSFLAPIAGVASSLLVEGRGETASAASDAQGHVELALLDPAPAPVVRRREATALLTIRSGTDSAFAVIDRHEKTVRHNDALWYVTDDRFTYKPGEKVFVKGWVRWTHNGVNPDLSLPNSGDSIAYTLNDSNGTKIASGTAALSAQGGFDVAVELPGNVSLGNASFQFATRTESHRHPISIQEFRTPAYSVALNDDVSHSGAAPLFVGESIEMLATAKYYSGGGLDGAAIAWDATLSTTRFQPPGWDGFAFDPPRSRGRSRYHDDSSAIHVAQSGSLSGGSTATAIYDLSALTENRPSLLTVDATVTDVDRMIIRASSRPILVHPSAYYVGIRQRPGTVNVLEAVVTDVDGTLASNVAIKIEIEGVLGSERYRDDAKVIETHRCDVVSSTAPVPCTWKRTIETAYTARARVVDTRGRPNTAQLELPWWSIADDNRDFAVVADKPSYRPGDVAKIDIRSKVLPATAIVSFARQGLIAQKRIELTKPSTQIELPIEVGYLQNVFVVVDRYAPRQRTQAGNTLPIPQDDSIELNLPVDVESARLVMKTRSTKKLIEPGAEATFEVEVRHDGNPVAGAEVALMVVDEAVLALSARSYADPLAPFYRTVGDDTVAYSTLPLVYDSGDTLAGTPGFDRFRLEDGGRMFGHGSSGYGVGAGGASGHGSAGRPDVVKARKDFRANAVFSPLLATDARGKVSLTVKMPDSLTRFRIVAIATANKRNFGKAEDTIVTQRKVNARTVAPRFLTQGDRVAVPVVVQNLDSAPRTIDLAVRAANLHAVGPVGKRVVVPGGQRAEVRFEFSTKTRGRAVIQTIATSGDFADASNVELPVYEPATTESFATYGTVDDAPQFEQLVIPASIFKDVGGVSVELASTQLQSLTDAFWYLYAYPYECAEQRSGRMLATAALSDILEAFATPGRPARAEIDAQRTNDVVVLGKEQRADGGWGYFHGTKSDPFVSQQVLSALAANKVAGKMTTRAIDYVTKQSNALFAELEKLAAMPANQRTSREQLGYSVSLAAATLAALSATGTDVRPRAERLHAIASSLAIYPIDAKARLLSIVAKLPRAKPMREALLRDLISATHETASAASVTTQYVESERLLLVSSAKTTALALDAIMREAPDHALVTKLARGVLEARRHGRWGSTQDNLVALQAMRRYFDTYEKVTPNYTGKLWLGTAAYAEQTFAGRGTAPAVAQLEWNALAPGSTHDVALVKQGAGRMYYRVGISYAPTSTKLPALDAGFIVRRVYTAVDDPGDVTTTPDGYKIRLGAKVLVTLEALTTTPRYAVALVDPLPAGFEAINDNLATSERVTVSASSFWDHVNLRDNRSEAFRMSLAPGTHRFAYTVRATTPGTFIVAPSKAEEMYSPETFGRSGASVVTIE